MNTNSEFAQTKYGSLKGIYDLLDVFHYGNVCRRSRKALLKYISETPENPLIIGCGTGDFTVEFIRQLNPSCITINDISQKMIDETVARIKKSDWQGNLNILHCDATEISAREQYDFISANYILNIFRPELRVKFVKKAILLLSKNGYYYVADFTRPNNYFVLLWALCNWYIICIAFNLMTATPIVPLGNLREELLSSGLSIINEKFFVGGMYGTFLLRKDRRGTLNS
jgi:ubiquinone/menaquinone biosynthesis C-methylase UbiE